ncbi:MAG TPA: IclR family transcriptional regulator C-terminal domain-containing protein [Candidatus Limnocylindria bacterium]|nr:IclR family transcriptional regulator C-terminal domain-containing protein [Candidatus Limnocylindria bacterium]
MADGTYRVVPAVDKAARLLAELSSGETLGISELARRIGASKGTVRDILMTLASHGLVERTADARFRRDTGDDLVGLAHPFLRALMEEFRETAILGVASADKLEIAARAEPETDLHMSAPLGRRIPLRAGAHGKVLASTEPIGYDDEEYLQGVRAAAAPVRDASGKRIAVLMVVGFSKRLDLRTLRRVGERCAEAANELSARLARRAA